MTEIKHILVASDLTDRSCLALGRAIQLKRASAAALTLLHVIEPGLTEELEHNRRATARATLETHLSQASHEELRRVIIEVLVGNPVSTIVAEAEARGADLIVLGEPPKRRLKELFVGTTAERVVRNSQRPVLVVKTQSDGPYQRVVVAFDLSEAAERVLDTALSLAPHAQFRLVHASGPGGAERTRGHLDDATKQVRDRSAYPSARVALEVVEGHPASVVANARAAFDADLLATGTHGRGRLQTAFLGSVAQELAATSACDILVTRP
jgi:nucleotide-binding universal stress UspA family protein